MVHKKPNLTPEDVMHSRGFLPIVLLAFTLGVFAGPLFGGRGVMAADGKLDLGQQFYWYRSFGFTQLRHGHLVLWNPHIFSGTPFMGTWQPGLLYPPNWIYLVLPTAVAVNWEIAGAVYIAGLGMALWARHHALHPLAALLAGVMVMFGGPFFLHAYAGHLAPLDAMAWAGFAFLAVDGLMDAFLRASLNTEATPTTDLVEQTSSKRSFRTKNAGERVNPESKIDAARTANDGAYRSRVRLKWGLLLAFAIAMTFLAGHPQSSYYIIFALIVYNFLRLAREPRAWPALAVAALFGITGALIAAVQIDAGLAAAAEGTRSGGVSYEFATRYSFPPENFFTAIVPGYFGDMTHVRYWGRAYYWEMCVFEGVCGLALALYGIVRGRSSLRLTWAIMVALLVVIGVGADTPIFRLFFDHVPGFDRFRFPSKILFEAGMFLAMAAAAGLDAVIAGRVSKVFAALFGLGGLLCVFASVPLSFELYGAVEGSPWQQFMWNIWHHPDNPWPEAQYHDPYFIMQTQAAAGSACLLSGIFALLCATCLAVAKHKMAGYCAAIVAVAEMVLFAGTHVGTFDPAIQPTTPTSSVASAQPDSRILQIGFLDPDQAMDTHTSDLWGYDPSVLKYYAEYMTYAEGGKPDDAAEYLNFPQPQSKMLRLFRLNLVYYNAGQGVDIQQAADVLPHVLLIPTVQVMKRRDEMLAAMAAPDFDFRKTVILEAPADDAPGAAASGTVAIHEEYPGCLTLTANVTGPSVALITDPYSRDWRAEPLPGSSQHRYTIEPADYAAMAIPLAPGRHNVRIVYWPRGFTVAVWTSVAATAVFLTLLGVAFLPAIKRLHVVAA